MSRYGRFGSVNVEVLDGHLSIDEVSVVLGIEDSLVDVLSREGDDGIVAVPETDRQELGAVAIWPADEIRTLIAKGRLVCDDPSR